MKFEGGKAVIKPESFNLMKQLSICKKSISQTCKECNIDNMSWRVEGHTAVSKKSTDGGMATSMDRARAGKTPPLPYRLTVSFYIQYASFSERMASTQISSSQKVVAASDHQRYC